MEFHALGTWRHAAGGRDRADVRSVYFYQQENGKRTIVHLLNEINSTSNRALPVGNPSMREEIVPLSGIKVLFHDSSITRVHLEPEAQDLPISKTSEGLEVTVPDTRIALDGCCREIAIRKGQLGIPTELSANIGASLEAFTRGVPAVNPDVFAWK